MGYKSGFIALMGCPNAGKSTLMNALIGEKVAIVSEKAQTTRNKVVGILTRSEYQMVFLDTPGLQTPKNKLGEYMQKTAVDAQRDVDLTIAVLDAKVGVLERDRELLKGLAKSEHFIVLNKADLVESAHLDLLRESLMEMSIAPERIVVVSAKYRSGLSSLEKMMVEVLPEGPQYYPEDMITDRPERFIAAELIREKALGLLRDEVPHGVGVEIEKVEELGTITNIEAAIYCERDSHKGIIIGAKGAMIKQIGSEARRDLEMLFGTKVFLKLFVKVKKDWRNSAAVLKTLGYRD